MSSGRWFVLLVVSIAATAIFLGIHRLLNLPRSIYIEVVTGILLVVIVVCLLGFLNKLRD
jgi:hypothetical protein